MKKILLSTGIGLAVIALIAAVTYWMMRPQVITLKDGARLTLVGVSYGKHHVFKGVKTTRSHHRGSTTFDTTNDALVVWIKAEHKSSQWFNYQLLVYDRAGTACVGAMQSRSTPVRNGVDIQGFVIDAFPRRDRQIILRVVPWGNGGELEPAKGEFVISNPGPRSFPQWQPDPMPDTQSDGDLDVTLTGFTNNARSFMYGNQSRSMKDPRDRAVQLTFETKQNGMVVTNWQPVHVITSDATGNSIPNLNWMQGRDAPGAVSMTYQWGLWPTEQAWKLRVEMSRTSGFSNDEIWAVSNVPVKKGSWQDLWNMGPPGTRNKSTAFAETNLRGIHLKIFPATEINQNFGMNQQRMGGIHVSADPDLPEGFRLFLAGVTDEQGHKLQTYGLPPGGGGGNYIFQLPDLHNAKTLNLTLALHQSRFVEFLVKLTMP